MEIKWKVFYFPLYFHLLNGCHRRATCCVVPLIPCYVARSRTCFLFNITFLVCFLMLSAFVFAVQKFSFQLLNSCCCLDTTTAVVPLDWIHNRFNGNPFLGQKNERKNGRSLKYLYILQSSRKMKIKSQQALEIALFFTTTITRRMRRPRMGSGLGRVECPYYT